MVVFSEMFASELIGDPVVDNVQEPIGKVKDVIVALGDPFPKVIGLLVDLPNKKKDQVLLLSEVDLIGRQFVATKMVKTRVAFTSLRSGDVLLAADIMDQQIVDVDGVRVIRVNDLKLARVEQEVRLIAADVGLRGFLRRLGLEKIFVWLYGLAKKKIPEQLIGWDHVQSLNKGIITVPHPRTAELHPADIAQIISQVHSEEKTALFSSLTDAKAAEALHELEPRIAAMLILRMDTKKAVAILEKMPIDEAADVFGDLPDEKKEELLRLIKVRKSSEIVKLLKHSDETAGGLMTTEFVSLPENFTVEQTINYLRETAPSAETIYYLYIMDEKGILKGVLSLRRLIVSAPQVNVSEIMFKNTIVVTPEMDRKKVAEIISKYNLLAVPVVDLEKKMLGIVTVDDVVDFILPPISRRKREMLG